MRNVRKPTLWVSLWDDLESRCFIIVLVLFIISFLFWICKRWAENEIESTNTSTSFRRTVQSQPFRFQTKKKKSSPRAYRLHYPGYTIFCLETRSMNYCLGGDHFGTVRSLLGELFGNRIVDIPSNAITVSIPTKHFRTGKRPNSFIPTGNQLFRRLPKYCYQAWTESVQAVCLQDTEELVGVCIYLWKESRCQPSVDGQLIVSRMRDLVVRYGSEWRPPLAPPLAFYNHGREDGTGIYRNPHRNTISGLMSRIQPPNRRLLTSSPFEPSPRSAPLRRPSEAHIVPIRRDTPSPTCSDSEEPPDYETLLEEDYGINPPQYWTIRYDQLSTQNETNYEKNM